MKWNWKEYLFLLILVWLSFLAGNWVTKTFGIENWGILGAFLSFAIPVAIIYYVWKRWLAKAAS